MQIHIGITRMSSNVHWLQIAEPNLEAFKEELDSSSNIKSVRRLDALNFDPMERMVILYKRLEEQEQHWGNVQMGLVTYIGADGEEKPVRYSSVAHIGVLNQMQKISADLLRYKYGRVPEGMNFDDAAIAPFYVMLEQGGDDGSDSSPTAG
jgi:hypothetical protein